VVFDLDGTLLNTLGDIAGCMNRVLQKHGFPTHETEAYHYFVGGGALALVHRTVPPEEQTDALVEECVSEFLAQYRENWNVETQLYDGVPEMLDALALRSVQMAVFSNKPGDFVRLCMDEYLSGWDFVMALGPGDGVPVKPDPTGACLVAEAFNADPRDVLYVGDTGTDMKTAVNAGMFPLGVLWGYRPETELRENGAVETISTPMELLDFVAKE